MQRRRAPPDLRSGMYGAFERALRERTERDPTGQVALPVGYADVGEIKRVLHAIDKARASSDTEGEQ
jgi:hypothetical protein